MFSIRIVRLAAIAATLAPGLTLSAQANAKGKSTANTAVPLAMSAIKRTDLERDLYAMAGDGMRGREAGTPDEMRASIWVAEQMRQIGVKPMGEDQSYFQWFNMVRTRVSTVSTTGARSSVTVYTRLVSPSSLTEAGLTLTLATGTSSSTIVPVATLLAPTV